MNGAVEKLVVDDGRLPSHAAQQADGFHDRNLGGEKTGEEPFAFLVGYAVDA
jgi:hypothetical protein